MNSDPHESAAWRTFGMFDADEAASFDEAMRDDPELRNAWREMNSLSAAVAAATASPIAPRAGQLRRLQTRLGLNAAKPTNWLAITGWAAAAALTIILWVDRQPRRQQQIATSPPPVTVSRHEVRVVEKVSTNQAPAEDVQSVANDPSDGNGGSNADAAPAGDTEVRTVAKVETKRLIQEIEVLREKLESAQKRDQQRFETVPGMAWPIVMRMNPPGVARKDGPSISLANNPDSLTTVLGDALAGTSSLLANRATNLLEAGSLNSSDPSAIPIYDAARDEGTLVVTHLPKTGANESYNLWVTTENGAKAIHVGRLPSSNASGADSFDFSLGSAAIVPTGFFLTKDPTGAVAAPSESNTVLLGPR